MIKSRYFPDKTFQSKEELFKHLKDNAELIIDEKKSLIQKSCDKGISVNCKPLDVSKLSEEIKGFKADDNYWYIVTNTTRILDSHEDLHLDGLWKKSIDEQKGKNYLTADHELKLADVIVRKEYVEMFTASIPYTLLGYSYSGNTQALIYKVPKDKIINKTAKDWLESGDSIEASVRMQYVTIVLAMDSNAPEDATEKKNYDDLIDTIANKDDFEHIPYFFGIKEAKNVKESSLVVFGSNHVTGVVSNTKGADVKCISCKTEFEYNSVSESGIGYVKCPNCGNAVTQGMKIEPIIITQIEIEAEPTIVTQNKRRKLLI